jgi:hypothetical protein
MKPARNIDIESWIPEDELTEDIMYDILYPLSKVDFIRLFPRKIILSDRQSRGIDWEKAKEIISKEIGQTHMMVQWIVDALKSHESELIQSRGLSERERLNEAVGLLDRAKFLSWCKKDENECNQWIQDYNAFTAREGKE